MSKSANHENKTKQTRIEGNYSILLTLVQKKKKTQIKVFRQTLKYTTVTRKAFQSKMCCNMLL